MTRSKNKTTSSDPTCSAGTPGVTGNRVVWAHDPDASNWSGGGYYGDYVNQERVDAMTDSGLITLTQRSDVASAWRRIIPDYAPGKKIGIKLNINNSGRPGNIDALAQPVNSVIKGLKQIGVQEPDIYILEPSRPFERTIGNQIIALYPDVLIWDVFYTGRFGHKVTYTSQDPSLIITHAHPSLTTSTMPDQMAELSYFINMPILKGHGHAGISLTFKNNYGLVRNIDRFHPYMYLTIPNTFSVTHTPLVDFYLNPIIREKTVLIIGDGIFGHRTNNLGAPTTWSTFNNDHPNSLFFSTDPVAIDSVMFDFLNAEAPKDEDSQLYLHRAVELGLGTHDHWNNPTDKQYSSIDFVKAGSEPNLPPFDKQGVDRAIKDLRKGQSTAQDVKNRF